jgi:hypothetical protein
MMLMGLPMALSWRYLTRVAPRVVSGLTAVTGVVLIWRGAEGVLAS